MLCISYTETTDPLLVHRIVLRSVLTMQQTPTVECREAEEDLTWTRTRVTAVVPCQNSSVALHYWLHSPKARRQFTRTAGPASTSLTEVD